MRKEFTIMAVIALAVVGFGVILFLNDDKARGPVVSGVNIEGAYSLGAEDAKVTIVEFADMQCPACAASVSALHNVLNKYPDKVRLVFKHFPLPQHRNAEVAAQAVEAAGEQGKFWEMYSLLYANQSQWENVSNPRDIFREFAKSLALNEEQFIYVIDQRKFLDKISADLREGNSLNVNATPTFFINGQKFAGVPNAEFERIIETEVNK